MATMAEMLKKEANRILDSNKLTDIVYGTVSSLEPLKINIDSRFEIDTDFLYVTPQCRDLSIIVGDKVTMIRYNKGQLYYLIEVNGEIGGGGGTGPGLPDGGVVGDIIIKNSSVDGDADWKIPPYEPKKAITDLYTTSGEKTSWNAKQNALIPDTDYLTPGKAVITYEPKKSSDDNFVTDAEKIKLGNLSGTNTGDQDLSKKADLVAGKVPSNQLPSFVDDVIEVANYAGLPTTGETGKIYVTLDTNKTYRWSGTAYVEISASLALGETSSTAYRGDRGKTAYGHSQATGNAHGATLAQITDDSTHRTVTDTEKTKISKSIISTDGSVIDIQDVTRAEYDALTTEQKNTGTYFITDEFDGAINIVDCYPVGSIFQSNVNTSPQTLLGGTWVADRTYYGGELLAYGIATTAGQKAGTLITDGVATPFASTAVGDKVYTDVNYVPGILTGGAGAISIQTKGIVGMVEVDMYISGYGASGNRGLWWRGHATGNPLPAGVIMLQNGGTGGNILTSGPYDANYGGSSNKYIYKVDSTSDLQFWANPMFAPYGGSFTPSNGGVACQLIAKVFAKYGTTYTWKRTA